MSDQMQTNRPQKRFAAIRTWLNRRCFTGARRSSPAIDPLAEGRRPGATKPVHLEISPATADPFPEPRTIPRGWDTSEMSKSK
jgi:hypothetical protein